MALAKSQGACQSHSASAEINHADTGAEIDRQIVLNARVWLIAATRCRAEGENAYKKGTRGRLSTSRGAETSIRISCWVMCTQKSCSPFHGLGNRARGEVTVQPSAK